jgi:hypothetical protein
LSGSTISGTPTAAGTSSFTVKATNAAGSATKSLSITVISPVGNEIVIADKSLSITAYPSPAGSELFIKTNAVINKVEVYSLTGKLLLQRDSYADRLSVSGLSSGIYLLRVYSDSGVNVSRFVKK